jgi:hypothetical protein
LFAEFRKKNILLLLKIFIEHLKYLIYITLYGMGVLHELVFLPMESTASPSLVIATAAVAATRAATRPASRSASVAASVSLA